MPSRSLVLAVTLVVVAPRAAAAEPPPLTHTTPLTPTGEVLARGQVQRLQGLTAFHHRTAVGLGGGTELGLSSLLLPLPVLGGDLELRTSILPADWRAAVVLGGSLMVEWLGDLDVWAGATATVAWREPGWNLHATLRATRHTAGRHRLGLGAAGVARRVGRGGLVYLEVAELSWEHPGECAGYHGRSVPCREREPLQALWLGGWWRARDMRVGLSGALVLAGGHALPVLPLLSFAWDHEL